MTRATCTSPKPRGTSFSAIDAATGLIETVAGPVDPACAYDGRSGCVTDFALDAAGRVVFVESSRRLLRLTLPEE